MYFHIAHTMDNENSNLGDFVLLNISSYTCSINLHYVRNVAAFLICDRITFVMLTCMQCAWDYDSIT